MPIPLVVAGAVAAAPAVATGALTAWRVVQAGISVVSLGLAVTAYRRGEVAEAAAARTQEQNALLMAELKRGNDAALAGNEATLQQTRLLATQTQLLTHGQRQTSEAMAELSKDVKGTARQVAAISQELRDLRSNPDAMLAAGSGNPLGARFQRAAAELPNTIQPGMAPESLVLATASPVSMSGATSVLKH